MDEVDPFEGPPGGVVRGQGTYRPPPGLPDGRGVPRQRLVRHHHDLIGRVQLPDQSPASLEGGAREVTESHDMAG